MKKYIVSLCLLALFVVSCAAERSRTSEVVPSGCISGNCQNGYGTVQSSSGTKYIGQWKNGNFHGQGTIIFDTGKKYVGQWKDGKFHGQGT